jgi:hypothetical protein
MNLDTYSAVQTMIAQMLDRADLTTQIPVFITLAETRLNRILADNVNLVAKITLAPASSEWTLPDDFNGIVSLSNPANNGGVLIFRTTADMADMPPTSGTPRYYTVSAGSLILWPAPSSGTTLTMRYRTRLDALKYGPSWLLENHPDAYVFGALVEAAGFIAEEPRLQMWQRRFDSTMDEINQQVRDIAFGGPLQVKSCGGE